MNDSEVRTMSTTAGQELRPVTSLWWLPLLFGVVTLGVGIFFVVSPHETLSTFTAIAGIFVLVDGVIAIVASIFGSGEAAGCSLSSACSAPSPGSSSSRSHSRPSSSSRSSSACGSSSRASCES